MSKLTREQLEAMASYLTSHDELRDELRDYLRQPQHKREEALIALWDRYGDKITARHKLR